MTSSHNEAELARYHKAVARTDALIDPVPTHGKSLPEVWARGQARLARLHRFLAFLGNPQDVYPIVHVGGTSGKGSTSAAVAAILAAAGYRTGLHTSPYLQVATEKLQLDGRLIAASAFADLVDEILDAAASWLRRGGTKLTYGEVWMALLTTWFARERVDVAVIEVGAGGRFDLTNVVRPVVSVITSVGLDHTDTLGPTIPEIAWHKAGIVKPGVPIVTAVAAPDALAPIRAEADAAGSPMIRVALPDNAGAMAENRLLATAISGELARLGFRIPPAAIDAGLDTARLPGRFERVQERPHVVLDGAHNPQKIDALTATLPALVTAPAGHRRIGVVGVLEAKDHAAMIGRLLPHLDELIATTPDILGKSALPAARLAQTARDTSFRGSILTEADPMAALDLALIRAETSRGDVILVTGSLYLVGNIRGRWYPADAIALQRTPWPRAADQRTPS